jgi:hypothetical protein
MVIYEARERLKRLDEDETMGILQWPDSSRQRNDATGIKEAYGKGSTADQPESHS